MACLLLFLFASVPVLAQQNADDRLNRLENEIQTLSRALFRGEMPPSGGGSDSNLNPAAQANLEVRLSQLEMEVRNLTGQTEQQQYEMRQLQEKLDSAVTGMEMRLMDMEARLAGRAPAGGQATSYAPLPGSDAQDKPILAEPAPATDKTPSVQNGDNAAETVPANEGTLGTLSQSETGDFKTIDDPAEAYETAFSLLKDSNYDEAEKAFTSFVSRFPHHNLTPNAKYWLGETFYVRNDFERAARIFAEAYQKYPKGAKGPDNLLKLALSLAGLGKTQDACIALAQLKREYPAGANPVLVRADREMQRLNCS